jgi:hypothetical protein
MPDDEVIPVAGDVSSEAVVTLHRRVDVHDAVSDGQRAQLRLQRLPLPPPPRAVPKKVGHVHHSRHAPRAGRLPVLVPKEVVDAGR